MALNTISERGRARTAESTPQRRYRARSTARAPTKRLPVTSNTRAVDADPPGIAEGSPPRTQVSGTSRWSSWSRLLRTQKAYTRYRPKSSANGRAQPVLECHLRSPLGVAIGSWLELSSDLQAGRTATNAKNRFYDERQDEIDHTGAS